MFCFSTDFDLNLQKPAMDIYFVKQSVCKTIFHNKHIFNGDLFFNFQEFLLVFGNQESFKESTK